MRSSVKSKKQNKNTLKATNSEPSFGWWRLITWCVRSAGATVGWTLRTPIALISVAVVALILLAIVYDMPQKSYYFIEAHMAKLAVKADVQLENVYLEGQNHTKTESILEVMDVKIGMPLFAIDLDVMRKRLEELPWVRYAEVERQYPSTLTVRIAEREPVALWQLEQKLRLVDEEGVVIDVADISAFSDYLILVGKNVPYYLPEIMEMLESEALLKPLVSSVVRVSDRRWDVVLRNDIRIMLPEHQPEKMWSYLAQLHREKDILSDYDIESINLKIPEKVFIERKSNKNEPASKTSGRNT